MLRNVTAHAVGCTVLDRPSRRLTLSTMVGKNSPIPCERIEEFFLEHDDQTEAIIEILQGFADADRDSCLVIGTLHLTGLPKEPVRTRRIRVECGLMQVGWSPSQ
jgi:molecular chaperone DnaK (HSP70)